MAKGKHSESVILKVNVTTFHGFANNYLIDAGISSGETISSDNLLRYSIFESLINDKAFNYSKDTVIVRLIGKLANTIRHMKSYGITPDKIDIKKTNQVIQQNYTPTPAFSKDDLKAIFGIFCKCLQVL